MADQYDVQLEDPVLLEEVRLVSSLMVAAGENEGPLPDDEIDQLLGLAEQTDTRADGHQSAAASPAQRTSSEV